MLKAILFDLDGTLLPLDTAQFINEYLQSVAAAAAADPPQLIAALLAGTAAIVADRDPAVTNAEVFWRVFRSRMADSLPVLEQGFEAYYAAVFPRLSRLAAPTPLPRQIVGAARKRGLRLVLATNPVFPTSAIRERMRWAGIDDLPWELVTSYENMHSCKPHPEYYREIAAYLGIDPAECLMVGNDAAEDLAAAAAGMPVCLITDYLIDPVSALPRADWSGTLAEFAAWLPTADLSHPFSR